jgi:hypothetical protein
LRWNVSRIETPKEVNVPGVGDIDFVEVIEPV